MANGAALMDGPTLEQYPNWASENIGFNPVDVQFRRRYTQNTTTLRTIVEQSDHWNSAQAVFSKLADAYNEANGVALFTSGEARQPSLHIKPIDSVVEKTYRANILNNRNFPKPPTLDGIEGWVTEENLFARMHDLIRCRLVCRYMDGPQYICEASKAELGGDVVSGVHSMETELGYYAWHLGLRVPAQVVRPNGVVEDEALTVEIQITTHLNDVLNDLTHLFYEGRRIAARAPDSLWKWQPDNAQFKGAYFGHTLHLLEGMIVELKNEIKRGSDTTHE